MMRLPPFTYLAPVSVADAVKLMADHGPAAMLVAGGTDLYPNMKRRQFEPTVLVGLRGIRDLAGVRRRGAGGLAHRRGHHAHRGVAAPRGRAGYPALATAAGVVSTPQLRNMGTLGGNVCVDTRCNYYNQSYQWRKAVDFCMKKDGEICLVAPGSSRCWAVSSSDTAPVLWSLGATRAAGGPRRRADHSRSPRSIRTTASSTSPSGPTRSLTDIVLPPADGAPLDLPQAPPARRLRLPGAGRRGGAPHGRRHACAQARIVLGAVASQPREATEAAQPAGRPAPRPPTLIAAARTDAAPARRSRSTTRTSRIPTARR